jgi:predicted dehydrogenase
VRLAADSGLVAATCFNLRYYPQCQAARSLDLGEARHVHGSYLQDWLALPGDTNWRVEPSFGGELRAVGDIGSHWLDLVQFVTGRRIESVCADLGTFVEGDRPRTRRTCSCASRGARSARWSSLKSARAARTPSRSRSTAQTAPRHGAPSTRTSSGSATASKRTRCGGEYPTFADGHAAMLLGDAIATSARERRWVVVGS